MNGLQDLFISFSQWYLCNEVSISPFRLYFTFIMALYTLISIRLDFISISFIILKEHSTCGPGNIDKDDFMTAERDG